MSFGGWILLLTLLSPVIAASSDFYTTSNDPRNNQLIRYRVEGNGAIKEIGRYATGGRGTGANLPSAGSIALSSDRRWLVAVNAGSNQISSFRMGPKGPRLMGVQHSKGTLPLSIALRGPFVYVLNSGSHSVATFRLRPDGTLEPFKKDGIRVLSSEEARATSLAVSRDRNQLVVAERGVNQLARYAINRRGLLGGTPQITQTLSASPFALSFYKETLFTVFAGQGSRQSSIGSYRDDSQKGLTLKQAPVFTGQTAACWSALSSHRRLLYAANAGSHSLTGIKLSVEGSFDLIDPEGVSADTGPDSRPRDLAISRDGLWLAVILDGVSQIALYRVGRDGRLTLTGSHDGVPHGSAGLVAR